MRNKHQTTEEPDEMKVSRPVLKTSGIGDSLAEFNPVQTIYRGLRSLSLGKCRNPVREEPGNPRSDSWEAYTTPVLRLV
jgi:hypothetical protein